jgi:hypothetical protein
VHTVQTSGVGQVGIRQCRADQVSRVRADVAALVVTVDDHVQAHELGKVLVLEAHHLRKVARPVRVVIGGDHAAVVVHIVVDLSHQSR